MSKVDTIVAQLLGKDLTLCRDYASIINWSIDKISKWTSEWTDFSITDPAILFVNADAYLYDIINYALDESYMNNILRYTKSMESLYFMSKFVGLELPAYESAIAKVKVSNPFNVSMVIPRHFSIYVKDDSTGEQLWFYALKDTTIPSNSFAYVSMIEGKRIVVDTTFEEFDAYFNFIIPTPVVGLNSVFLFAELDGEIGYTEFIKVDDAFLNTGEDLCFSVHYAYNHVIIKLPPGIWEYLKPESKIRIYYGQTSGVKGNIGTVLAQPGEKLMYNGIAVQHKFSYQILSAEGASEPLNLEDTRVFIGNNSWRVDSLINTTDFNNFADANFDEVIRFVIHQDPGVELLYAYFVPVEGLSDQRLTELTSEIYDSCSDLMFGGTRLSVQEIGYQRVSFRFEITLGNNSSDLSDIRQQIIEILENYFDRLTQPAGMTLRRSYLISQIETSIKEIDNVACISPTSDIAVTEKEIFVLAGVMLDFLQK